MCKCVHYWTDDDEVTSDHNKVPVTCEQVIADLEDALRRALESSANSLTVLGEIRHAERMRAAASGAWAGTYEVDPERMNQLKNQMIHIPNRQD